MGAVNGFAVGVMQALVLARHRIPGAFWAVANPPARALGWFVSSYVISRNIDERFPIFGASGAIVFGLLTGACSRSSSEGSRGPRDLSCSSSVSGCALRLLVRPHLRNGRSA